MELVVKELEKKLTEWANQYAHSLGLMPSDVDVPNNLHYDEASGFMKALEHGIIDVDQKGRCSLPKIHRSTRKPTEPCLFSIRNNRVYLAWREYITQVGAIGTLVADYGWPVHLVALDPRDWEFDVATFDTPESNARMLVAGETKKTERELQKLLNEMLMATNSNLPLDQLSSSNSNQKYRGLLKEKAPYFWAVAPGLKYAFKVSYTDDNATLTAIADIPSYADFVEQKALRR
jgi:hypothetical protein